MQYNEIPLFPDCVYHIYTHANGKENLFVTSENYLYFLKRYAYFIEPIAETYAYCLMPNHIHLMVKIRSAEALQKAHLFFQLTKAPVPKFVPLTEIEYSQFLSKTVGNLLSSYTLSFNKQQTRRGSLFIPNFKRKQIDSEHYYTQLIRYIHRNPVHHGFIKNLAEWEFSSYHTILSDKPTRLCRTEVIDWFGSRDAFIDFHQEDGEKELPESFKLSGS